MYELLKAICDAAPVNVALVTPTAVPLAFTGTVGTVGAVLFASFVEVTIAFVDVTAAAVPSLMLDEVTPALAVETVKGLVVVMRITGSVRDLLDAVIRTAGLREVVVARSGAFTVVLRGFTREVCPLLLACDLIKYS